MKTNYMGLWAARRAWYISKPMTQKQISELPKKCRIILRENKYHKNNEDGTPRFIFAFADAETSNAICFEIEGYQDAMEEIKGATRGILLQAEQGERSCDDYNSAKDCFCAIEYMCKNILANIGGITNG